MKVLDERHRKAIAWAWAGYSRQQIADTLKISRHTVDWWWEFPIFQQALTDFQDILVSKLTQDLSGMAIVGADVVRGLMQSSNEFVRLRAAQLAFKIVGLGNDVILVKPRQLLPQQKDDPIDRIARLQQDLIKLLDLDPNEDDVIPTTAVATTRENEREKADRDGGQGSSGGSPAQ
ncbi:MAG: hypothetical protein ABSG17_00690 [Spirochaetia bacterium]|jgi:hypothetical protein